MNIFKKIIHETPILLLYENFKVEINFIIFYEADVVKLRVFDT
jgi:hypothetical protein